jgi:hypothetical protein
LVASYELTDEEVSLLGEVINQHLADMRYEIADTDNARFKGELRERYEKIQAAATKLGISPPA